VNPPFGGREPGYEVENLYEGNIMITLGVVLLVIGFVAKVSVLWSLGIILLVVGAVLYLLGSLGHEVGGRRHYF